MNALIKRWWQVEQWMPGAKQRGDSYRGAWAFPCKEFRSIDRAVAERAKLARSSPLPGRG